jgi:regulator of RNase E activity RraA
VRGTLIDGAVRDVAALRALGAPVYARGAYPGRMRGRLRLGAVGEPVELGGRLAEPGSHAVADSSGTVVVPAARLDEILGLADAMRRNEEEQLQAIRSGADPRSVLLAAGAARPLGPA